MNNEPAFPTTEENGVNSGMPGLTLRDYFAAKVMQGSMHLALTNEWHDRDLANWSYATADAMLVARKTK